MTERKNLGRGTCRVCGIKFNLTSNGRIRSHGPRDERCAGGSDLPAESPGVAEWAAVQPDAVETCTCGHALDSHFVDRGSCEDCMCAGYEDRSPTASAFRDAGSVLDASMENVVSEEQIQHAENVVSRATEYGVRPDIVTTVATNGTPMTMHGGPNPHRAPLTVAEMRPVDASDHYVSPNANRTIPGRTPGLTEGQEKFTAALENPQWPEAGELPMHAVLARIQEWEARGVRFNADLPPRESLADALARMDTTAPDATVAPAPFVVIPDPVAFTTAVPVSATPTVRGGATLRPGPEKNDFDQWGRYKIPDPITGAVNGRQRVTTFVKMISDQWGLSQWQQRVLLIGAAQNPNITQMATGKDAKADKAFLDGLATTLKDAAGSKEAAAFGTAMHTHTERFDMGLMDQAEFDALPAPISRDLFAYTEAVASAGLVPVREMVERTTMVRSLDVTGTLDRVFRLPDGSHVIGDVKTGQDLSYGWLDIGMQLACYAQGINENGVFDWGTRQWIEAPKVRTDFAIVMHMPAGKGTCTLYRVNIEQGWANCALARSVRDARKVRNHAEVLDLASIPAWGHGDPLDSPVDDDSIEVNNRRSAQRLAEGPSTDPNPKKCPVCKEIQGSQLAMDLHLVNDHPQLWDDTDEGSMGGAEPAPVLAVQPHSESFGIQGGAPTGETMWRDDMALVRTQAEAATLYTDALNSGVTANLLQELSGIGFAALDKREKARKAMASVTSQQAAGEIYAFAAEVWGWDREFLAELTEIGKVSLATS